MSSVRFGLRYSSVNRFVLRAMGLGPARSGVWVDGDSVRVAMGWGFRAEFPRQSVRQTSPGAENFLDNFGGVHGWGGRWIVTGSSDGLVRLDLAPAARARVMGIPRRLESLRVSVQSAPELTSALSRPAV